jgi:hypothetical protein
MAPARTVQGRLGLAGPSPSLVAVPPVSLSALDQALDGLGTGSSLDPGTDSIVLDVLHARRRRANCTGRPTVLSGGLGPTRARSTGRRPGRPPSPA